MRQTPRARPSGTGLFNRRRYPRRIEFLSCHAREQVLVQDVGIELNPSLPNDRRGFSIHRSATKSIHVTPSAEVPHIEQIPQKHAALQAVLELQPELVVPRRFAIG